MIEIGYLFFLGYFTDLFADFTLVLKIFAWLSIIAFISMHFGKSPLALALIIGLSWFILFDYWRFFGSIFLLFTLLTMGISGILIDFFFVSQGITFGQPTGRSSALSSGLDLAERQKQLMHARRTLIGRRPPGM